MKVARTVWSRGKDGDNFKVLPIAIFLMANNLTRELAWFMDTLRKEFGLIVTADVIAIEAVELGIDEVDDFFVPSKVIATFSETLLYEIMVVVDKIGTEWVGAIAFHPNSPEWCLQVITKNGQQAYRNLLPLDQ